MPVAIERRLDGGVAELRLDVLGMGALRDEQAGVRVAQVVEADPPDARAMWGEPSAIRVARCAKFGRSMSAMASADNGVGMDTLLGVSMGCRRKADLKPKLKGSCRTLTPREKEDPAGGLDELMAVPRRSRWEPTLSVFPNQLRVGDRLTDAEGEWGGRSPSGPWVSSKGMKCGRAFGGRGPPAYVTARGSVPKRCAIRLQISSNLMPLRIGFNEGRAMIELPIPAGCEYFVSP